MNVASAASLITPHNVVITAVKKVDSAVSFGADITNTKAQRMASNISFGVQNTAQTCKESPGHGSRKRLV